MNDRPERLKKQTQIFKDRVPEIWPKERSPQQASVFLACRKYQMSHFVAFGVECIICPFWRTLYDLAYGIRTGSDSDWVLHPLAVEIAQPPATTTAISRLLSSAQPASAGDSMLALVNCEKMRILLHSPTESWKNTKGMLHENRNKVGLTPICYVRFQTRKEHFNMHGKNWRPGIW